MSEWSEIELGDIAEITVGHAFKSAEFVDDPEQVRLLRGINVGVGRLDWKTTAYWPRERAAAMSHLEVGIGDVIVAMDRPWIDAGLKIAIARDRDLPALLVQRVARLRAREGVSQAFLGASLRTAAFADRLRQIAGGVAVPHISASDLATFPLAVPDVALQRSIGAVVAVFDDLIENYQRRIDVLEDLARSLYREWFVRFRFPGHETAEFVDSELGLIPDGWVADTVAGIALPARNAIAAGPFGSKLGRKDYRPTGVPVVRGTNLRVGGGFTDDGFVFVDDAKADSLGSAIARPGDVLVTQRGTLGQVGLLPMRCRFDRYVISQSQMKISTDLSAGTNLYVYFALSSPEMTEMIVNRAITAGVPHINLTMLRELPILRPVVDVQRAFKDRVSCWIDQSLALQEANRLLAATRDLLLPRLVTGKLDISEIDLGVLTHSEAA
jgi:type I restriction enzyme S subunit